MNKIVRIGTSETRGGRRYSIYCHIRIDEHGTLLIAGVEGPTRGGNCLGACGQICGYLGSDNFRYAPGWDEAMLDRFKLVWERWHLGGGLYHDVGDIDLPTDVVEFLESLPVTDRTPAWV